MPVETAEMEGVALRMSVRAFVGGKNAEAVALAKPVQLGNHKLTELLRSSSQIKNTKYRIKNLTTTKTQRH
jgi:hypothetical protein